MVVGRALAATRCASCRLSLLNNFVSLAGPSIRAPDSLFKTSRAIIPIRQSRHLSQLANDDQGFISQIEGDEEGESKNVDSVQEISNSQELSEQTQISAKPWYLQVGPPQRPVHILQRQELPELPEHPPPILQPLLQQLSIDLGLDNLSLLDLRKLDPPPALGANLIMLIGTARSEKHLHVSADRLCRWFRSNYRLRPSADGLLGRNELKLKLRRKAKRAKLLGGTEENADDGIRTGWICVDVGIVQEAEGATQITPTNDFIGFGRRIEGVRLVVQLLTEEKREEIDLERLWNGILKRGSQQDIESTEPSSAGEQLASLDTTSNKFAAPQASMGNASGIGLTRGFHTDARLYQLAEEKILANLEPPPQQIAPTLFEEVDIREIQEGILLLINSGDYEKVKDVVLQCRQIPQLQGEQWRAFLLDLLKTYLENVPQDQAKELLGVDDTDVGSTGFLRLFNETIPASFTSLEAEIYIWLLYYGREIGHPGYNNERLLKLFHELQSAGVKMTRVSYTYLLRSVLLPYKKEEGFHGPSLDEAEIASHIIHVMHDQGFDVLTEDIILTLQEVTTPSVAPQSFNPGSVFTSETDTFDIPSLPMPPIQKRIHVLMKSVDIPLIRDEARMKLMDLYARNNYWVEFWDIFRMAPQHNQPQSAIIYAVMFSLVAKTNHQKACMAVLRTWVPELKREEPSIKLQGDVGRAVKRCLKIAEPYVEEDAEDPEKANNEWVSIWRQCE